MKKQIDFQTYVEILNDIKKLDSLKRNGMKQESIGTINLTARNFENCPTSSRTHALQHTM